jgi:LPXTG-motif cell wall-anchored protein
MGLFSKFPEKDSQSDVKGISSSWLYIILAIIVLGGGGYFLMKKKS